VSRLAGSPTLVLVPTSLEWRELRALGGLGTGLGLEEEAGFGPVAAAARTASILARIRPARVLLLGIAGSYDAEAFAVGTAVRFARVEIDGLDTAGFAQAPGIGTGLDLARPRAEPGARRGVLVTVSSASGSSREAAERRERHADAVAEDMEGFGVALACALERVPLAIVRGISNAAGDRDPKSWRIREALEAARRAAIDALGQPDWELPA